MTDDQIIEIAHDAGITFVTKQGVASATEEFLTTFARLIAAKQKEIDAQICELGDIHESIIPAEWLANADMFDDEQMTRLYCAAAIRKGGMK